MVFQQKERAHKEPILQNYTKLHDILFYNSQWINLKESKTVPPNASGLGPPIRVVTMNLRDYYVVPYISRTRYTCTRNRGLCPLFSAAKFTPNY